MSATVVSPSWVYLQILEYPVTAPWNTASSPAELMFGVTKSPSPSPGEISFNVSSVCKYTKDTRRLFSAAGIRRMAYPFTLTIIPSANAMQPMVRKKGTILFLIILYIFPFKYAERICSQNSYFSFQPSIISHLFTASRKILVMYSAFFLVYSLAFFTSKFKYPSPFSG